MKEQIAVFLFERLSRLAGKYPDQIFQVDIAIMVLVENSFKDASRLRLSFLNFLACIANDSRQGLATILGIPFCGAENSAKHCWQHFLKNLSRRLGVKCDDLAVTMRDFRCFLAEDRLEKDAAVVEGVFAFSSSEAASRVIAGPRAHGKVVAHAKD